MKSVLILLFFCGTSLMLFRVTIADSRRAIVVIFLFLFFKQSIIFLNFTCWGVMLFFSGGAVSCASVHLGEIRPGGFRGNHRHHTCNETFVIWGAKTKFRVCSLFHRSTKFLSFCICLI